MKTTNSSKYTKCRKTILGVINSFYSPDNLMREIVFFQFSIYKKILRHGDAK